MKAFEETKTPYSKIFNIDNTYTWKQMKAVWGGPSRVISRSFIKDEFEWNLISKENWSEYELQTIIFDSHECGILFDYIDERNYSLLHYSRFSESLVVGRVLHGRPLKVGSFPMPIKGGVWMPKIKVNKSEIKLYFGDVLLTTLKMPFRPKSGKFGLFIREFRGNKRPVFGNIGVKGITASGESKEIRNILDKELNYPPIIVLLYLSILGVIFTFAKIISILFGVDLKAFKFRKGKYEDWIHSFVLLFAAGLLFVRTVQSFGAFDFESFKSIMLWKSLGVCFAGYMIIMLLAKFYALRVGNFSTPMYFMFFSVLMYFLSLFNLQYFGMNDQKYLFLILGALCGPLIYRFVKPKRTLQLKRKSKVPFFSATNIALLFWFVFIVVYSLENNFLLSRTYFNDEGSLWAISAQDMIKLGVLKGHLGLYGGLATQSLGTPFFNALPALLLGSKLPAVVFFMPAVIMPILWLMIFNIAKKNKWMFLFLFLAMVSSFGKMIWVTHAIFRLVFSDNTFVIYLLLMLIELRRLINKRQIHLSEFLMFSLIAGSYPLLRSTGAVYGLIMLVVLTCFYVKKKGISRNSILQVFIGFALLRIPFSFWKVFRDSHDVQAALTKVSLVCSDFSVAWLYKVWAIFWLDHKISIIFMAISVVFMILTFKRKDYSYGFLPFFLFGTVVFYFALIQTQKYNCEGSVDRYMLPAIITSFYLGAIGFDIFVKRINRSKLPKFCKILAIFALVGLLSIKLL